MNKFPLFLWMVFATASAQAAEFNVVQLNKSQVNFVSKQMNVPVEGVFKKFSAQLSFDPAKPETAKVSLEINLNSVDAGSSDANTEVKTKAWFDTQHYPIAKFVSTRMRSLGEGRFEVIGKLTIKGKTLSTAVPVNFKQLMNNEGQFDGVFTLKRLQYGIGEGLWSDTSTVADEVLIRFRFLVTPTLVASTVKTKH